MMALVAHLLLHKNGQVKMLLKVVAKVTGLATKKSVLGVGSSQKGGASIQKAARLIDVWK